jgi:adenylate kinase family enzyme
MARPTRVSIVGATGSGKTTLARELAARLGLGHVDLDALYWGPNWTPAPDPVLRRSVEAALASGRWVVDGNYTRLHDLTLAQAQVLVWLDYSFPRTAWQLLRRTFGRAARREELWNGNRESFREALLSRRSILLWLLQSYGRHRRQYRRLIESRAYPQLTVVHLRSPHATRAWLASLGDRHGPAPATPE